MQFGWGIYSLLYCDIVVYSMPMCIYFQLSWLHFIQVVAVDFFKKNPTRMSQVTPCVIDLFQYSVTYWSMYKPLPLSVVF